MTMKSSGRLPSVDCSTPGDAGPETARRPARWRSDDDVGQAGQRDAPRARRRAATRSRRSARLPAAAVSARTTATVHRSVRDRADTPGTVPAATAWRPSASVAATLGHVLRWNRELSWPSVVGVGTPQRRRSDPRRRRADALIAEGAAHEVIDGRAAFQPAARMSSRLPPGTVKGRMRLGSHKLRRDAEGNVA